MTRSNPPGINGQTARKLLNAALEWIRPAPMPEGGSEVTTELVAKTLARGGVWLQFPAVLERRFEQDTGAARCRTLIWSGLIMLLLTNFFSIIDYKFLPDVFNLSLIIRLGVCTPLGLLAACIVALNPRPWLREATAVLMALASASLIMILAVSTSTHAAAHLPYGIILVIMFVSSVQVLRFPCLPIACAGILAITFVGLAQIKGDIAGEMGMIPGLVFGAAVLGCVAGYSSERGIRLAYLNGLLQHLYADRLEEISHSDPLTGVGNRRALDKSFNHIARRSPRTARMAAILIDIDYFKQFNDTYGHDAGDQCLRRVADILASEARATSDGVFRLGGEEFLVLLSGADIPEARIVAERMRVSIMKAAIPHIAPRENSVVTASFGVASGATDASPDLTHLMKAADAALYGSKRSGRNQVSVADPTLVDLFAQAQQANAA